MGRFFREGVWSDGQHCFVSTSSIANGACRGGKSSGFIDAETNGVATPTTTRGCAAVSQSITDGGRGMVGRLWPAAAGQRLRGNRESGLRGPVKLGMMERHGQSADSRAILPEIRTSVRSPRLPVQILKEGGVPVSDALRSEQVTQWIKDLDSPDCREAAAARIVEKYTERLLQLIRGKLHKRFQGILDSEDVAQSVWRCFFDGQFELANRSALLGLLTKIAVTRTQDAARRLDAAKRDRRREQPFVTESNVAKDGARVPKPLPARQRAKALPLPEEISVASLFRKSDLEYMTMGVDAGVAAMVIEMFESLPLDLQQVLAMDVEGYSRKEIAEKLGNCDEQTVRRKKERIRRRLEQFQQD